MNKPESRNKKFMHNSLSTAFYQVIVMVAGFITPRIMLTCYGSEINGLVSSIQQFINYFTLVEAGISGAAVFSLYLPLAENDHKKINSIVSAARNFYFQAGYIFVALVGILSITYPLFIKTSSLPPLMVGLLVLALGGKGFLDFFTLSKYRVLLTADQRTYVISLASSIYIILNTVIIVVLSYFRMNVVIVYALAIIAMYVRSLILQIYVKRHYKFINYKETPDKTALNKRWYALYLQILGTIHKGAPTILATLFTSLKTVSVYSIYNMVLSGINSVLSIFISGLSASFGDVIARGETKTLQKSYGEFSFAYYALITVAYSVTAVMIVPFVLIYTSGVHDISYNVPVVGFLFALDGLLYNMKTPQGMLVISAGLYKETRIQTTIQALLIIIPGIILGNMFGLVGILIACCISNIYRTIDLMIFIPKYVTHLPVSLTLKRYIRMFIQLVIIMLPFFFFTPTASNFFVWALWAFAVFVYACVVVLVTSFLSERKTFMAVVARVKGMLKKKG